MDPELQTLAAQLADTAVRNSAGAVADRIGVARARRKDQETIAELEDIVNELVSDKSELVRIAQAFEQEMVAQRISESDLAYITSNLLPVLTTLMETAASASGRGDEVAEIMAVVEPLLSIETVTVLQLIGFNFRRAIGEPLTELVSRLILARAQAHPEAALELQKLGVERELAYLEVAQDAEAHARLTGMFGGNSS